MHWTAILTVADTGPRESLVEMLDSIGIDCVIPTDKLRSTLQSWGLDCILDPSRLEAEMGYSVAAPLPQVGLEALDRKDTLVVDVKAHRNYDRILKHKPNLAGRILWYRINGGQPEHVVNARGDFGDERNPPCPILTPNLWYKQEFEDVPCDECPPEEQIDLTDQGLPRIAFKPYHSKCGGRGVLSVEMPWRGKSFACWPPFSRISEYNVLRRPGDGVNETWKKYANPVCLVHNLQGWGYGNLIERVRQLGVRCYGLGSPDGLLQHGEARIRLESALALVHLKSSDAPGYALYEALASGCPIICPRRLIWRNRMEDLLVENETCLCFDRETHDSLSPEEAVTCSAEIEKHLKYLSSNRNNKKIGLAGRERLQEVMWSSKRDKDVESLRNFFKKNFPNIG